MTELDIQMNRDIDNIIKQLIEAKNASTYLKRASMVQKISDSCNDYEFYWTDRLYSLMD